MQPGGLTGRTIFRSATYLLVLTGAMAEMSAINPSGRLLTFAIFTGVLLSLTNIAIAEHVSFA